MNQHDATDTLTVTLHRILERFDAWEADADTTYFEDLAARVAHIEVVVRHIYLTVVVLLLVTIAFLVGRLLG